MAGVAARTSALEVGADNGSREIRSKGKSRPERARVCLALPLGRYLLVRGMEEANPSPKPNIDGVMRHAKPCNALLALSATNPAAKSLCSTAEKILQGVKNKEAQ